MKCNIKTFLYVLIFFYLPYQSNLLHTMSNEIDPMNVNVSSINQRSGSNSKATLRLLGLRLVSFSVSLGATGLWGAKVISKQRTGYSEEVVREGIEEAFVHGFFFGSVVGALESIIAEEVCKNTINYDYCQKEWLKKCASLMLLHSSLASNVAILATFFSPSAQV